MRQTLLDFKAKKDTFIKSKDSNDSSFTTDEKAAAIELLKSFDLDSRYGPCIGLSRLERYQRALKLGLSPNQKIIQLLETYPSDPIITDCIWNHLK